ncbi:MAG: M48 family metallopeptidase [Patescibacteria group bacterium]
MFRFRLRRNRVEFLANKELARSLVRERIDYFNQNYDFAVNRISIRNQRCRWGSCSRKGNLNFNYRIVLLSPKVADYIIVHELCHLGEFNHSKKFWNLVAKTIPDYTTIRKQLRAPIQ